jgi:hypothetical protein
LPRAHRYGHWNRTEDRIYSMEVPPRSAEEPRRNDSVKLRQATMRVKSPEHQRALTFVTLGADVRHTGRRTDITALHGSTGTRCTPAMLRLPRRRTSQRPCRK